jgi:hypothetical protein
MATVNQVKLTCDVCGATNHVKTRTFGLDGQAYEIDLCRKDGNALGRVAARYVAKARKVSVQRRRRQQGGRPRSRTAAAASADGGRARAAGTKKAAKASRPQRQSAEGSSTAASAAGVPQHKGIFVYGILPADIEVAGGIPGVGEHPGLLRDVRCAYDFAGTAQPEG